MVDGWGGYNWGFEYRRSGRLRRAHRASRTNRAAPHASGPAGLAANARRLQNPLPLRSSRCIALLASVNVGGWWWAVGGRWLTARRFSPVGFHCPVFCDGFVSFSFTSRFRRVRGCRDPVRLNIFFASVLGALTSIICRIAFDVRTGPFAGAKKLRRHRIFGQKNCESEKAR